MQKRGQEIDLALQRYFIQTEESLKVMTEETCPRFFYCFLCLLLAVQFCTVFFICVFLVGFCIIYQVTRQTLPLKRGRCSLLVLAGASHKTVLVSNKRHWMSLLILNDLHLFFKLEAAIYCQHLTPPLSICCEFAQCFVCFALRPKFAHSPWKERHCQPLPSWKHKFETKTLLLDKGNTQIVDFCYLKSSV